MGVGEAVQEFCPTIMGLYTVYISNMYDQLVFRFSIAAHVRSLCTSSSCRRVATSASLFANKSLCGS